MQQQDLLCARKFCQGCELSLPESDFPLSTALKMPGPKCRACLKAASKAYMKAWHAAHPGYAKDRSRKWYAENVKKWRTTQERKQKKAPPLGLIESERLKLVEQLKQREPDKQIARTSKTDGLAKVYFVQEGDRGPIKIGFTESTLIKRLTQLQNGNPRMLNVLGVMSGGRDLEQDIHQAFGHLVIQGTKEWFQPAPELLEFIKTIAALPEVPQQNKTGFRGVYATNKGRQYAARVRVGDRSIIAGYYLTAREAAVAYDEKARELLKDKALLNFPRDGELHWSTGGKRRPTTLGD